MKSTLIRSLLACAALGLAGAQGHVQAQTQTTVTDPWMRPTVPEQKATGMFLQLQSAKGGRLVSARTPAAGITEIHEMAMEGDVMKMRAIPSLELPAGKPVALKPGGHHLMLFQLRQPLKVGDNVPVQLVIQSADGKTTETMDISVPVRLMTSSKPAHAGH
jgi:periplasmic copper chaperone A